VRSAVSIITGLVPLYIGSDFHTENRTLPNGESLIIRVSLFGEITVTISRFKESLWQIPDKLKTSKDSSNRRFILSFSFYKQ